MDPAQIASTRLPLVVPVHVVLTHDRNLLSTCPRARLVIAPYVVRHRRLQCINELLVLYHVRRIGRAIWIVNGDNEVEPVLCVQRDEYLFDAFSCVRLYGGPLCEEVMYVSKGVLASPYQRTAIVDRRVESIENVDKARSNLCYMIVMLVKYHKDS